MKFVAWLFYTTLAVVSVFVNFSMGAIIMASVTVNRWLVYPAYFGTCMMLSGMVFLVFLPFRWRPPVAVSIIDRVMARNDKRFSRRPWPWIRRRGPFALTLFAAFALGPFVAALVMRILGLSEQKAWWYAFVTNLITTGILVSFYLGLFTIAKNLVMHLFA